MIHFFQPSTVVSTWRTLWPGLELRNRGYEVQIESMDAGYGPPEPPRGALTVIHVTPSLWVHPRWKEALEAAVAGARELVVSFDDDWTRIFELEG